jgi:hypothetical protein
VASNPHPATEQEKTGMKLRSSLSLAATAFAVTCSPAAHADSSRAIAGCQAAVAAIAKHNDDDNLAFDKRSYLKRECSEEIRAHLDRDHGRVVSIDLQAPYVHHRVMSGTGEV